MTTTNFKAGDLLRVLEDHAYVGRWRDVEPGLPVLLLKYHPATYCDNTHNLQAVWDVLIRDEVLEWRAQFIEAFCEKIT